jgi:hypothetical protein
LTRIAAKQTGEGINPVAVTPLGDEPESSVGTFSGGNFKVGTLERIYHADATLDEEYIGKLRKGNRILSVA